MENFISTFYKLSLLSLFFYFFASQNVFAQLPDTPNSHKSKVKKPAIEKGTTVVSPDTLKMITRDSDGDGIPDGEDKCPDEKGVLQFDGCPMPDTDNDGLTDDLDSCPQVAGLIKYNGCPIPDRDGDKINDEEDNCPDEPGLARFNGCLTRDSDGDSVNDDEDKCPDIAGPADNNGCPDTKAYRKKLKQQEGKKK